MRKLLFGLLLVLTAEGAALACSCIAPGTPEESREFARQAVSNAVAIVEADVLSEYRYGGDGELVRARRVLWGEAPDQFRIARGAFASGASCDLLLPRGERKLLILYPRGRGGFAERELGGGDFEIQSLCSDFLLGDGGYLDVTLEEARRLHPPTPGENGERG